MQGMTVAELIEQLQELPQDKVVAFSYDYGDRGHTQVVKDIKSVDIMEVEWSGYTSSFMIADGEDIEDEDERHEMEQADTSVVVLM
jgi:hypothetical protein